MFDWVHNNRRLMQGILALVFLPFAFFGVDSYFRGGEFGAEVARIGDYRVSQQEYQQALRERQAALQRMVSNAPLDPAVLDSPELRFAALDELVREHLMLSQAIRSGMAVPDEQLRDFIVAQQAFRDGGQFSHDLYETYLRSQNMNQVGFEARLRRDLLQQPLMNAFGESVFVPRTLVDRIVRLSEQSREVSVATISPGAFAGQVKVDDATLQSYYQSHAGEFQVPEQVRLEYVVLSLDNLAAQVDVPAEEVRQAYEQGRARFTTTEERHARHILLPIAKDASADAKAAVKAQAEDLLKQARAKPDSFADLARKYSQDPGSAKSGGDLGYLERGATKKPFDDALFAMQPGEIVGPVETEYGYHLIKLEEVRGGAVKPFEEVRASIEADMKRTRASKRFAELGEQLNNLAYEQSDSLKPAAEALKIPVQQSPWIARKPQPGSPLGSERFLKAVFSEDVIGNKRNSEVVEVAPGTLIAARMLEHKPVSTLPFEQVRDDIRKRLIEEEARKLARAAGREKLEQLRKGDNVAAGLDWGKPLTVRRAEPQGLSEPVLREVFRLDATKTPAYGGAEDPAGGFKIVRLTRVNEPQSVQPDVHQAASEQLKKLIGQEQLADYVAGLKQRVEIKVKPELVEKKQGQ